MATHREHEKQWFLRKIYSSHLFYRKKISFWTNEQNRKRRIEDLDQILYKRKCISIVCKYEIGKTQKILR